MPILKISSTIMRFLKCVIVFLVFILIVGFPWFKLLAASDGSGQSFDGNEAVDAVG